MNKWLSCGIRCIAYIIGAYFFCLILSLFILYVPYGRLGQLAGFLSLADIFLTFRSKNGKIVVWGKKKEIKEDKIVYVDEIRNWDNRKK